MISQPETLTLADGLEYVRTGLAAGLTIDRFALCGVHGSPASAAIFATRSVRSMPPTRFAAA